MCIFHVLMVMGLPGSEGASALCMALPGNAEAPLATRLSILCTCSMCVLNLNLQ